MRVSGVNYISFFKKSFQDRRQESKLRGEDGDRIQTLPQLSSGTLKSPVRRPHPHLSWWKYTLKIKVHMVVNQDTTSVGGASPRNQNDVSPEHAARWTQNRSRDVFCVVMHHCYRQRGAYGWKDV